MGVQTRSVHNRIAVHKQGWAIIILKCRRGHDNVHKRIAVYKQGWALVPANWAFAEAKVTKNLIYAALYNVGATVGDEVGDVGETVGATVGLDVGD